MPRMDLDAIMTFVIRLVAMFLFIIFIMVLFFSFRTQVVNDDMKRFGIEMSDSLAGSNLTSQKSIFSAEKLFDAEGKDASLYARSCEYVYTAEIKSIGARKVCRQDGECQDFCRAVLGKDDVTDSFGCNFELFGEDFCECKKEEIWQDGYHWKIGKTPPENVATGKTFRTITSELPAGLETKDGNVIPAKLTITAYDTLLTRLSCMAQKAYDMHENVSIGINFAQLPQGIAAGVIPFSDPILFGRRDPGSDNVCVYTENFAAGVLQPDECRYMPGVPIETLNINNVGVTLVTKLKGTLTAYPLKFPATCEQVEITPGVITGFGEDVQTVIICAKAA